MYPFLRLIKEFVKFRNATPLEFNDTHISHHRVWPWDIDQFLELNNGRTLMLYDLGRFTMGMRAGLMKSLRRNGWGLAVAGVCVRYRRRLRPFERFEMRTKGLGWDDRFFLHRSADLERKWRMRQPCGLPHGGHRSQWHDLPRGGAAGCRI